MARTINIEEVSKLGATFKVVVFFETAPLSDQFEQVMLTPKQAKAVRDAISSSSPTCAKCGGFQITTNDDHQIRLKDIKDEYTDEEIGAVTADDCAT